MGNKKKKVAEYISTWTYFNMIPVNKCFFFFFSKIIFNAKHAWNVRIDG